LHTSLIYTKYASEHCSIAVIADDDEEAIEAMKKSVDFRGADKHSTILPSLLQRQEYVGKRALVADDGSLWHFLFVKRVFVVTLLRFYLRTHVSHEIHTPHVLFLSLYRRVQDLHAHQKPRSSILTRAHRTSPQNNFLIAPNTPDAAGTYGAINVFSVRNEVAAWDFLADVSIASNVCFLMFC
jgi:hypothetical protein